MVQVQCGSLDQTCASLLTAILTFHWVSCVSLLTAVLTPSRSWWINVMSKPQACSWQHTVSNIMIYQTFVDFANSECIVASACSIRSLHLDNVAFWCYRRHQNLGQTLFQDNVAFCFLLTSESGTHVLSRHANVAFCCFFSTSESRTNVVFCVQEVT